MECNPTRMCELMVGSGEVNVLGVDDRPGGPIIVKVESRLDEQAWVVAAGRGAQSKTATTWCWWTCRASVATPVSGHQRGLFMALDIRCGSQSIAGPGAARNLGARLACD